MVSIKKSVFIFWLLLCNLLLSLNAASYTLSGTIFNADNNTSISNATIVLYQDTNNNSQADINDTLIDNNITDINGSYSFSINDGRYFILVDSKSLNSNSQVWMEQKLGPKGSFCADGSGGTFIRSTHGQCFGGKTGDLADDFSSLTTVEHIAMVDVNGSDEIGLDFSFSSNLVTNTNDNGQGSLRAFIQNSSLIAGENVMKFVPTVPKNASNWWSITLDSPLPMIEDNQTVIDGTAYNLDESVRDANGGEVGGGIFVGTGEDGVVNTTDDSAMATFSKKELEIDINQQSSYGLKVYSGLSDITIKNIAIFGSSYLIDSGDILISEALSNIVVSDNFIGMRADGTVPSMKSQANGITLINNTNTISNFMLNNNYIGYQGASAMHISGVGIQNGQISNNEIFHSYHSSDKGNPAIEIFKGAKDTEISKNYIYDNNAAGIDAWEVNSSITVIGNTITRNGYNIDENPNNPIKKFGLRSTGDSNLIKNNHIYSNSGAGIVIGMYTNSLKNALYNKITKNSIYENGELGIDLDQTLGNGTEAIGDGLTVNNGTKNSSEQNEDVDYPIFTKSFYDGNVLHIEGYVGVSSGDSKFSNMSIEIYKSSDGEGKTYLTSCATDSIGNFSCDIATTIIDYGDFITATATDSANNSSEFGEQSKVSGMPFACHSNSLLFTSDLTDDYSDVYNVELIDGNVSLIQRFATSHINATGYNVEDNYIYGYRYEDANGEGASIVKIDANYRVEELSISGLTGEYFYLGDVSKGIYYLANRSTPNNTDTLQQIERVDINNSTLLSTLTLNYPVGVQGIVSSDFAFNPLDNQLYMVNATNNVLIRVNIDNGNVEELGYVGNIGDTYSVISFFDKFGNFYFYVQGNNKIYKIDVSNPSSVNPTATEFSTMLSFINSGDGARCANATIGDKPILTVSDVQIVEGYMGTKDIDITITSDRPIPYTEGLRLNYTFSNGTAIKGSDYDAVDGSFFMYNQTYHLILSGITGDTDIENDEDFYIRFTAPVEAESCEFTKDTSTVTIINDDFDIELQVVDETTSFDWDGNISTKVANKPFNVTVLAYNHTLSKPVKDMNITSIKSDTTTLWSGSLSTDENGIISNIPMTLSDASSDISLQTFGNYLEHPYSSYTNDHFAVRPKKYKISVPTTPQHAGVNFTLKVEALDELDNPTQNYNETNTSFIFNYSDINPSNCITGQMSFSNITFTDGEAILSTNYSEVGMLKFAIVEKIGNEFAKIDTADTPLADRKIEDATSQTITFFPDKLNLSSWSVTNTTPYPTLFYAPMSSIDDMGARFDVTVQAVQNDGVSITQNYKDGCYAKNTDVSILFDTNATIPTTQELIWQDVNDNMYMGFKNINIPSSSNFFIYNIDKSKFNNGSADASIWVNFGRKKNKTKEPIRFLIKDVQAKNSDNITGNKPQNVSPIDFYYARLHAPLYSIVGESMDAKVFYEVYSKTADKSIFTLAALPQSEDAFDWHILDNDTVAFSHPKGTNSNSIVTGFTNSTIHLQAPKLPYADKISYIPKPWLLYNKYNASISKDFFSVKFSTRANNWAGKGDIGKIVDKDISQRTLHKMQW